MYDKKIDPKCHICFIKGNNLFKIQSKCSFSNQFHLLITAIKVFKKVSLDTWGFIFRYLNVYL